MNPPFDGSSAEGLMLAIAIRALFLSSLASILVYLIHPPWLAWASFSVPGWARWAGACLSAAGLVLYAWALAALGRHFGVTLAIKKDHSLVTDGPYRWVRQPMYSVLVLMWMGFLFLTANWFIGLTGLLTMAITIAFRTAKEEEMLLQTFGDAYRSYMQPTGRYLPRISTGPSTRIRSVRII